MNGSYNAPSEISRWQAPALGLGIIALLVWCVGFYTDTEQALRSWLLGFIFWGGIGIGGLGILLLQYLTGGAWGIVVRRVAEAASRTIPILGILFIPLMYGITSLYEWSHLQDDPIVKHRIAYLNPLSWGIRAVVYFALFSVMAYLLNKWSLQQDRSGSYEESAGLLSKMSRFSGPTMVFFALTVSFAAIDWVMTMDPHYYSTIWGLLFVAGWALSCFAFIIALLSALSDKEPYNRILGKKHFHDIGKLMLALVMVWAYFNFSQFLIIWSGNLPEETPWYITRMKGTWGVLGVLLIVFHFAFPFIILLNREFKRTSKWLAMLAVFILLMRLVDMFYLIGPSPRISSHGVESGFILSWMDFVAPVAIGGIWLWWFFMELKKRPVVPVNDPFLENAIAHGKGH